MELFEKTLETKDIYNGHIFRVQSETVELPDGKTAPREIVLHTGGVGVIAQTVDGKIPMVRQFRNGIKQVTLEIPAGKLEANEDPKACGKRELEEETGLSAQTITLLSKFAPTPAYCSEIIYIYKAENLTSTSCNLDEDEYLDVEYYSLDELYNMILTGEIIDAKTIIAISLIKAQSDL